MMQNFQMVSQFALVTFCNNPEMSTSPVLCVKLPSAHGEDFQYAPVSLGFPGLINHATGIAMSEDRILVAFHSQGEFYVAGLNKHDLKPVFYQPLPEARDVHSILVVNNQLYVVSTGTDEIIAYDIVQDTLKNARVVWFASTEKRDTHHINSIIEKDGQLLISAFGLKTGDLWASAPNGYIHNITQNVRVIDNIYHPHSLSLRNEQIYYCESHKGALSTMETQIMKLSGYSRGISWLTDEKICIATSVGRQVSRSSGQIGNPSDPGTPVGRCSVVVYDLLKKEYFADIDFSWFGTEIYDVLVLPHNEIDLLSLSIKAHQSEKNEIQGILSQIVEKDEIIFRLNTELFKVSQERTLFHDSLKHIVNSRTWKLLLFVSSIRARIFPAGSFQERTARTINGFLHGLYSRITSAFTLISKGIGYARKYGIKAAVFSTVRRYSINNIVKYSPAFLIEKFPEKFKGMKKDLLLKNAQASTVDAIVEKSFGRLMEQLDVSVDAGDLLFAMKKSLGVKKYYQILSDFFTYEKVSEDRSRGMIPLIQASELPDSNRTITGKNILFVTSQFPNPYHGGGNRILNFMKILSENNNVYLAASYYPEEDDIALDVVSPYCRSIYKIPHWQFGGNQSEILTWLSGKAIDFVHYEWPLSVNNYDPAYGRFHIFTYMEAVSLRLLIDLKQMRPLSTSWVEKFAEMIHALKVEIADTSQFDVRIAVTTKDGEFFRGLYPCQEYVVLNHGVPFDEFGLADVESEPNTIVFVGNYAHYPNTDAMLYFFEEIWDGVRKEVPDVKIYLIGYNPPEKLSRFANGGQVVITGAVSDIRPYIQKAAVCIAPLITGAGLRGKVIDYAALRRTFVATSIAVTDLDFRDGVDYLKADNAEEFTQKVILLLKDKMMRQQLAESAYRTAQKNYDTRSLTEYLYRLYNSLEKVNPS